MMKPNNLLDVQPHEKELNLRRRHPEKSLTVVTLLSVSAADFSTRRLCAFARTGIEPEESDF
jgi:hypothetical protein